MSSTVTDAWRLSTPGEVSSRTIPLIPERPALRLAPTAPSWVELPAHVRDLGEPLTPGELNHLLGRGLDRTMVVAWCVFAVLFVSILVSTVWLLGVIGGA